MFFPRVNFPSSWCQSVYVNVFGIYEVPRSHFNNPVLLWGRLIPGGETEDQRPLRGFPRVQEVRGRGWFEFRSLAPGSELFFSVTSETLMTIIVVLGFAKIFNKKEGKGFILRFNFQKLLRVVWTAVLSRILGHRDDCHRCGRGSGGPPAVHLTSLI